MSSLSSWSDSGFGKHEPPVVNLDKFTTKQSRARIHQHQCETVGAALKYAFNTAFTANTDRIVVNLSYKELPQNIRDLFLVELKASLKHAGLDESVTVDNNVYSFVYYDVAKAFEFWPNGESAPKHTPVVTVTSVAYGSSALVSGAQTTPAPPSSSDAEIVPLTWAQKHMFLLHADRLNHVLKPIQSAISVAEKNWADPKNSMKVSVGYDKPNASWGIPYILHAMRQVLANYGDLHPVYWTSEWYVPGTGFLSGRSTYSNIAIISPNKEEQTIDFDTITQAIKDGREKVGLTFTIA